MEGQLIRISQRDSQPLLLMIVGRSVSEKSERMTWNFEWMPRLEKFSKKSWWAFSSRNWMWRGVESKEEDASKRRVFRDRVVLQLGAMRRLSKRKREREAKKYQSTIISKVRKEWYVCMKNEWTCDTQQNKHHELSPIQTYQHTRFQHIKHTSKIHETLWKCKCDAMYEHIGSFKHNLTQKFHK